MSVRWRKYVGRKVRLHVADHSVEGVLVLVGPELLVLRAAVLPRPDGDVDIEGEAVIERSRVVFAQVLP